MSSPTPISEEEAETLRGLLVGSDKYKSRPGILPELFTYQPSPLRTSPPNRPSVPEDAYLNKNRDYFSWRVQLFSELFLQYLRLLVR